MDEVDAFQSQSRSVFATLIENFERRCKITPANRSRHLPARTLRGAPFCALEHGLQCQMPDNKVRAAACMCQSMSNSFNTLEAFELCVPRWFWIREAPHYNGVMPKGLAACNVECPIKSFLFNLDVLAFGSADCVLQALNAGVVKMNVDTDTRRPWQRS